MVVGPNRQASVKGESENVNIVRIAVGDSSGSLPEFRLIHRRWNDRHRQRCDSGQDRLDPETLPSGEYWSVLFDFTEGCFRYKYLLDSRVDQSTLRPSTDDSGQEDVSVRDEFHGVTFART